MQMRVRRVAALPLHSRMLKRHSYSLLLGLSVRRFFSQSSSAATILQTQRQRRVRAEAGIESMRSMQEELFLDWSPDTRDYVALLQRLAGANLASGGPSGHRNIAV